MQSIRACRKSRVERLRSGGKSLFSTLCPLRAVQPKMRDARTHPNNIVCIARAMSPPRWETVGGLEWSRYARPRKGYTARRNRRRRRPLPKMRDVCWPPTVESASLARDSSRHGERSPAESVIIWYNNVMQSSKNTFPRALQCVTRSQKRHKNKIKI